MPASFSLQSNGATPKNSLFSDPKATFKSLTAKPLMNQALERQSPAPTYNVQNIPLSEPRIGTNPGMIKDPGIKGPVAEEKKPDGSSIKYHAPIPQAVPDYGSDVKDAQGNIIGKAMYDPNTGKPLENPNTPTTSTPQNTPIVNTSPTVGNPLENAQNVLNAGQQTENEKMTQQGLLQAGQATPLEQQYIDKVQQAQGMKNAGLLGGFSEAGWHANQTPEQLYNSLINSPDLIGRYDKSKALYDTFSNIYGSQATQGLLAANTIAGRGLTASQSAYTGAQNQASRAQGSGESVLTAGLPTYPSYGSQIINPLTGLPVNGGTSGNLQEAVSSVVQKLTNGQMSYNDAVQALSGYGQGGVNALQQALPQGFNIAQSNTLSGTQGSIKPSFDYAKLALQNLKDSFANLSVPGQSSNIQPLANITNWFSNLSGIGKEAVRTKEGALAEARSAIQKVLASIQGGTPTDYTGQSHALLKDNATPADVDAAMSNLLTLGQGKVDIYGNPGQSNNSSNQSTGGNMFGSFFNN